MGIKMQHYIICHNKLPAVKWFKVINKIRCQHDQTSGHQYKIGIAENPYCRYGQRGYLTHMIVECVIYKDSIKKLYMDLIKNKIELPKPNDSMLTKKIWLIGLYQSFLTKKASINFTVR